MNFFSQTKTFSHGDFLSWLTNLEFVLAANGAVFDDAKAKILPVYLEGEALEFYLGLPDKARASFALSCTSLKNMFEKSRIGLRHELESCKISAYETFISLTFRVSKIVDSAYKDFPQASQIRLVMDKFLDVISKTFAKEVLTDANVVTIDQAIEN